MLLRESDNSPQIEQLRSSDGRTAFIRLVELSELCSGKLREVSLKERLPSVMFKLAELAVEGSSAEDWRYYGIARDMLDIAHAVQVLKTQRRDRVLKDQAQSFYEGVLRLYCDPGLASCSGTLEAYESDQHALVDAARILANLLQGSGLESIFYSRYINFKQIDSQPQT